MTHPLSRLGALSLLSLLLATLSYAQVPCETGSYCFEGSVYECVDGVPQLLEECDFECSDGACVYAPLEPAISYPSAEPAGPSGGDYVPYIILIIVALTVAFLLIRLRMRKK